MKYAYTVVITPEDNHYLVSVPDLPGCHTFGETEAEAILMAQDAIEMWLWDAENNKELIPQASKLADVAQKYLKNSEGYVSLVAADTDEYRRKNDTRAVKKTLSIPSWLNYEAEKANAPFSQILQQGLKEYLQIS